jgi:hypothetical protein
MGRYNDGMTAASHVPRALQCHAASEYKAARGLAVVVCALDEERILFSYLLDADLERLRIPAKQAAHRAHELWMHTCFEAFLGVTGASGYCELNFAPSKEWAMYRFSARREGMTLLSDARAPHMAVHRTQAGLRLDATVFWHDLIKADAPIRLRVGIAAVLEDEGGRLSYWALQHAPGKPDFHHPDSFSLELDL